MKIIFVRHGHPNYKDDCLTELGHKHAEAAADRLSGEKIDKFYSSTCGRAVETAEHIAERFGASVEQLEFMREIAWRGIESEEELPYNGNPWLITADMVAEGKSLTDPNWKQQEPFCRSKILASFDKVEAAFDSWLEQFGYFREGQFYRVKGGNDSTLLLASHAGSSTVVLSHLLNLPPLIMFRQMGPNYTGITVMEFDGEEGELIAPNVRMFNDARHIEGLTVEVVFDN